MDMMRPQLWLPMAVGLNHCCSGFSEVSVCPQLCDMVTNEGQ